MRAPRPTQLAKPRNAALRVEASRPRNPFHNAGARQKAGSHAKGERAIRRAENQALRQQVGHRANEAGGE
jgi:glutaminase